MRLQHNGDGDHRIGQRRAEDCHQNQRQQERRKGEDDIHQPHDEGIKPARRKARHKPDENPARGRDRDHDDADIERVARAMQQPRQHVATHHVGAKNIGPATTLLPDRRLQERVAELLGRIMRGDHIGQQSHQNKGREHPEPDHRPAILAEIMPELAQPAGAVHRVGSGGGIGSCGHQRFLILGLIKP